VKLAFPATPAAAADRQLPAADESEPAARAEESMPELAPPTESPRVEPVPPPEPVPAADMRDRARGPQQPPETRELASVDVQPQPQPPVSKLSGKQWVPVAYARRPDELHAMGITGASEALAGESKTAPDCAKPLTARYIEKLLRELKVFPKAHRGSK